MKNTFFKTTLSVLIFGLISTFLTGCSCAHSFKIVEMVEPTCTETGVKKHLVCNTCKKIFDINTKKEVTIDDLKIVAFGHDFKRPGTYVKQPSCVDAGIIRYQCVRCEETQDVDVPAYGTHNFVMETIDDKYLFELGDCTHKSIYYKSCPCGEPSSVETFEGDYHHELEHFEACQPSDNKEGNIDFYSCSECSKNFIKENNELVEYNQNPYFGKTINLFRKNGKAQSTLPSFVEEYLKTEDNPLTKNNEIAEFMHNNEQYFGPHEGSSPIFLSWSEEEMNKPFKVSLFLDNSLTELSKSYENIMNNYVEINNLVPRTYFYQVQDSKGNVSCVDSFSFNSSLRSINTQNTIINFRDLGGWSNKDGKKVQYEKLYRTANWDSQEKGLETLINSLNIKTELDVRLSTPTSSHPIQGVNFINTGFTDDYSSMLTDATTINNIKSFVSLLTDETNYPIAYHCSAGADRTGLGSLIIESILGLNDIDIFRDYELTSFFNEKRLRSDVITDDDGNYMFNPDGLCDLPLWKPQFGRLTSFCLEPYKEEGFTISNCVVKFLLTRVNVTQDDINQIRNIMLTD